MGLILDLICSVLAIPFFLLGIVSKGLAILLQEMLKSAVYIVIDLFAAFLVGVLAEFIIYGMEEGFLSALSTAAALIILILVVIGILAAMFGFVGEILVGIISLVSGILMVLWGLLDGIANTCMAAHGALLGSILKRSQEGSRKDNDGH